MRGRCRCLSVASHRRTTKTFPVSSELRQRPLILSFSPRAGRRKRERRDPVSIPPLSRQRAEAIQASSFSRCASRPSFAARTKATDVSPPNKIKGGGAPEGANRIGRTTRTDVATCPRLGRGARHGRSAHTNHPLRARSPLGAPPRLWPWFLGLGFRLQARFPGTRLFAGVTRAFLSQSSGSTPRTGRNTGGHDARSRPGAVCETARGNRTRSTFRIASRKRPC